MIAKGHILTAIMAAVALVVGLALGRALFDTAGAGPANRPLIESQDNAGTSAFSSDSSPERVLVPVESSSVIESEVAQVVTGRVQDTGVECPQAMLAAVSRVRAMASKAGIMIPRRLSGPPEMWSDIGGVDAAYGVGYLEISRSFSERLLGLSLAAKPEQRIPIPASGTAKDKVLATRSMAGSRHAFVANGIDLHMTRLDPGEDAELDRMEEELNGVCMTAGDAVRHILTRYQVAVDGK